MKLIRLKLNDSFRSLAAGFEVHFLSERDSDRCFDFHPYCLAGRNGSGKSNVLEALAAIFYHIECIYLEYRPDGFEYDEDSKLKGFRAEVSAPDAFELEYFLPIDFLTPRTPQDEKSSRPVAHVYIKKMTGKRPEVFWVNRADFMDDDYAALARNDVKTFLPRFILGYSSGHNEILSLPFFKMRFIHFDEYRYYLTIDQQYTSPEGRMIYLDEQFSQAILLCHFLFPSEAVTKVFEEKIELKGIRRFRIIIRRHHYLSVAPEHLQSMSLENQKESSKTRVELTSNLSGRCNEQNELQLGLIDKLIKCSTTHYEDSSFYVDDEGSDLILDYLVDDETRKAFKHYFGVAGGSEELSRAASALNLFQALQTLLTLNLYKMEDETKTELYRSGSLYLNETIPMPASHERIMRFKHFEIEKVGVDDKLYSKALSDGEHQLLHTIGLCLLFRHESALFLLDEPETHLNPDWRASYVSTLRSALETDNATMSVMREILLTSHSPFIISDCREENVLVFKKDSENRVTCEPPGFQTFGASSNAITIKIFEQRESIGDYALGKIKELGQQLEEGGDPDKLIAQAGRELGDSVEKVLFINQALDKKEGK